LKSIKKKKYNLFEINNLIAIPRGIDLKIVSKSRYKLLGIELSMRDNIFAKSF